MSKKAFSNMYDAYLGLIKDRVNYFHKKNKGIEYDEINAQANFVFCKAYNKFNPERNISFSTYLYTTLNRALSRYIYKESEYIFKQVEFTEDIKAPVTNNTPEVYTSFLEDTSGQLSDSSKEVITTIFTAPITSIKGKTRITMDSLNNYFCNYRKWPVSKYRFCIKEIKTVLNQDNFSALY